MPDNFLSSNPQDLVRRLEETNRGMQEREAQAQAKELQLTYLNAQGFPIDLNSLALFTEEEAKSAQAIPFYHEGNDLRLAIRDPRNPLLYEKVAELSKKYQVSLYFVSLPSFADFYKFYGKVVVPKSTFGDTVVVDPKLTAEDWLKRLHDLDRPDLSASELLMDLFGAAQALLASDIHIEPEAHLVKVRFRLDGVLQDMVHLPAALRRPLTNRIKILSKLKINIENVPQDGRLTFYRGEQATDVRVSSLPSNYGESFVLRLLGIGAVNLHLDQLGLRGRAMEIIQRSLHKPNGMIITTGPTGSGKTTTLYTFLHELNKPGVKIITLEDPIEYQLEGIQQTPIDYRIDFSFAKGLRSVLRQDPDIVMVGEIRDVETADTALQAALTGHIVLTTLHTNDAAGAIPRLVTMGVKSFTIAPALNAIIAQRLVRKLCQACKQPADLSSSLAERAAALIGDIAKTEQPSVKHLQFYHSPGCAACNNLGYQGRIGIYEVIEVNDGVRELILKESSGLEIKRQAVKDGMVSMVQDGLLKALEGITDVEEVFRVAGD